MRIAELLFERDRFLDEEEIKGWIVHSKNYEPDKENPKDASAVLMFETSKQQTWLVSTRERMYCILDDLRKGEPHINWSMPRNEIVRGERVVIDVNARPKSENTGFVDISDRHKNWLFSRRLFSEDGIVEAINNLITRQMIAGD